MPKKKIAETEVTEVEQPIAEDVTEATATEEDTATGKSKMRIPFAMGMVLVMGFALALIVTVFGDKADMLVKQFNDDTVTQDSSVIANVDVPVADLPVPEAAQETTLTEQELAVEDSTAETSAVTDLTAIEVGSSSPNAAAMPYVNAMPLHAAQAYKDMQQQRRQAFERSIQRQKEMMTNMSEMRKTVFQQAEKRRQEAMARMQERQSEIEKQQMEMLQRRQQAFERSMQRT